MPQPAPDREMQALDKAATELTERELLLQQILDTSSVAIFLVSIQGRITHANRRMAEMFRWTVAELVGKEYVELIDPVEREIGRTLMFKLLTRVSFGGICPGGGLSAATTSTWVWWE